MSVTKSAPVNEETTTTPPTRAWFALVILPLIAGAVAAWWWLRPHGIEFSGHIQAQTRSVTADRAGIITSLLVAEGDRVTLGDTLLTLADGELHDRLIRAEGEVNTLTARLAQAEAEAAVELSWRMKEIEADAVDVQLRSADYLKQKFDYELERTMWADVLSGQSLALANTGDAAFQSLVVSSTLPAEHRMHSMLRHEAASNAVEVSTAQVELCDRQLIELRKLNDQLPERVRQKAGIDVIERSLALAKLQLDELRSRQESLMLKSTAVGTVGVFRKHVGDALQPGDAIVDVLDDARRWLVVDVPSAHIPEFTVGRPVDLTFPGEQPRRGRVFSIAPQAEPREPGESPDPTVIVRVEQCGREWPGAPIGSEIRVRLAK